MPTLARGADTITVVVLPFIGRGSGGTTTAEAIELELEMNERVRLSAGRKLRRAVDRDGKEAFDTRALSRLMNRSNVDVVIRGERVDEGGRGELRVYGYSNDGQIRWLKERPLPRDPERAGSKLGAELVELLDEWDSLPRLDPPGERRSRRASRQASRAQEPDEDDSTVVRRGRSSLFDDDEPKRRAKPKPEPAPEPERTSDNDLFVDDDLLGDDDEDEKPKRRVAKKPKKRVKPKRRRGRSLLDDDDKGADDDDWDKGLSYKPGGLDSDDDDDNASKRNAWPKLSVLAGPWAGAWRYILDADNPTLSPTPLEAIPGVGAAGELEFWPLANVGVEAGGQFASYSLVGPLSPAEYNVIQYAGRGAAKVRFLAPSGFAVGLRAGLQYMGASAPVTTLDGQVYTLTPGHSAVAAEVGAELGFATEAVLFGVRGSYLGFLWYGETPDNPGNTSVAHGFDAQARLRYTFQNGVFVQGSGGATGAFVTFDGEGQRISADGATIDGAKVQNMQFGGALAIGYSF